MNSKLSFACLAVFLLPLNSSFLFADISADGVYTRPGTAIDIQIVDCGNPNCNLSSYYTLINRNLDLVPADQLLSIKTIQGAPMDYTNPVPPWYATTNNSITLYVDYANKYYGGNVCGQAYFAPFYLLDGIADQVYNYRLTSAQRQSWNAVQPSGGFPPAGPPESYFIGAYDSWLSNSYRVLDGLREPTGLYIPPQDVFFMAGVMTDPTTHQIAYNQNQASQNNPLCAPIIPGSAAITLKNGLLTIAGTNVYQVTNNTVTAVQNVDGTFQNLTTPLPLPQILLDNLGISSGTGGRRPTRPVPVPKPRPTPRGETTSQLRTYIGSDPSAYIPITSSEGQARLSNMKQAIKTQNLDLGSPAYMTHQVTEQ
jgi:hypothetical protein